MNGLIYLSTPRFTVGLIVKNGVVVQAPPITRRWALGMTVQEVWSRCQREGNVLKWVPDDMDTTPPKG